MKWLGLTGGIGSGKSSVSEILIKRGWTIVDADEIAKNVLAPGTPGFFQVIQAFGSDCLNENGQLDRKKLGNLVFSDPKKLLALEKIVHPLVQEKVMQEKIKYQGLGFSIVIYDVPLLFEKNLMPQFEKIIVIYCTENQQIERLRKREELSLAEIKNRMKAQIPIDEKKNRANFIVDNTGSILQLQEKVTQLEAWMREL